jgi:multicomponent Na+:H+ antiporter subunit E
MIIANIILALIWCALWGHYSFTLFLAGYLLGYGLLWALARRGVVASEGYVRKAPLITKLVLYFLWELLAANLRLAKDLVTPGLAIKPRIIALPLEASTDAEIFLLSVLITLTPGTMTVDVSPDRSTLYIHALYGGEDSPDELRQELKAGFERRVLEVMR